MRADDNSLVDIEYEWDAAPVGVGAVLIECAIACVKVPFLSFKTLVVLRIATVAVHGMAQIALFSCL